MLRKNINTEIRWFLIIFAAVAFIGSSFGLVREAALLCLTSYIIWNVFKLKQLENWVNHARHGDLKSHDMTGTFCDIAEDITILTKRHKKEKSRLKTVVNRIQDMTAALSDGVILVDKRSHIEWWNQAAESMIELKNIDAGYPLTNIIRDPSFQEYFENKQYDTPLEIESFRTQGIKLLVEIHPFGKGERLITVRDITRVAKLEEMRRDFVANVSHELRTPLTVILGYVETLMIIPNDNPILNKALTQIDQQGKRMTSLVHDLITLTKLETDDRTNQQDTVNLHSLVDLVFNDGRAISDKPHELINEVDPAINFIAHERELHSAISNLVYNAVKYASNNPNFAARIIVCSETNGHHFHLHVKDNGVGIDPIHIPRLTERFYRVDSGRSSQAGGTGLGLAIVKHVLIRHDANLRITSKLGVGSTFTCEFPLDRVLPLQKIKNR